jgi:hypothetical protein
MQRACEADFNAAVKPQASEEIEGKAMSRKAFQQILVAVSYSLKWKDRKCSVA